LKSGNVPSKNISQVEQQRKSVVYLIDRPDSLQSVILAGHVAPPKSNPDEIAIETMNTILGGTFTSRREHESGAKTSTGLTAAFTSCGRPGDSVRSSPTLRCKPTNQGVADRTRKGTARYFGQPSISEKELNTAQKNQTLQLPGGGKPTMAVANSLGENRDFGLPDDYFTTYTARVRSLSVSDVDKAAKRVVHPNQLVGWS